MSKRIFTAKQIEDLLRNPNVFKCSAKSIGYTGSFKTSVLKQNQIDGAPAKIIFTKAGFDLNVIGHDIPKQCLERWRKTIKIKGAGALEIERRGKTPGGGRPRTRGMSDAEKIERLEATVAYLQAEKAYFMKLRAQRKS